MTDINSQEKEGFCIVEDSTLKDKFQDNCSSRFTNHIASADCQEYIESLYFNANECDFLKKIENIRNSAAKPEMQISKTEGSMIYFFRNLVNAKNILEIGTHVGYSTCWLARNLQDGHVWSLEKSPIFAQSARYNIASVGIGDKVTVLCIDALELCNIYKTSNFHPNFHLLEPLYNEAKSTEQLPGMFDMIFIDANKSAYLQYFNFAAQVIRSGGLLLIDNCLMQGKIYNKEAKHSKSIEKMSLLNRAIADSNLFTSIILPFYDGWTLCFRNDIKHSEVLSR